MRNLLPRLSLLAVAFAVCLMLGAASCVYAQIPVLSPSQYNKALGAVADAVQSQIDLENGGAATHAVDPQDALQPILHCQVRDPAGQWLIDVDNIPLRDSLSAVEEISDPDQRAAGEKAILAQIQQIRAGLDKNASSAGPDAAVSARQVLSAPEFSALPIPPPSRFDKAVQAFDDWINKALSKIHGPSGPTPHIDPMVPLYILGTILGAALIFLIALLVVAITRYLANRKASVFAAPESSLAMTGEEATLVATRDFERLLALAQRHRDDGDHRSAFRLVFLATLVYLDSEGIVRLNRSKTNWEYLRSVRNAGEEAVHDAMVPFTRNFDRIWYGLRPAESTEYDEALESYGQVRNALMRGLDQKAVQPARA